MVLTLYPGKCLLCTRVLEMSAYHLSTLYVNSECNVNSDVNSEFNVQLDKVCKFEYPVLV